MWQVCLDSLLHLLTLYQTSLNTLQPRYSKSEITDSPSHLSKMEYQFHVTNSIFSLDKSSLDYLEFLLLCKSLNVSHCLRNIMAWEVYMFCSWSVFKKYFNS